MKNFSNAYILRFIFFMVVIVAGVLSFISLQLQPIQEKNYILEKKVSILKSLNVKSDFDNADEKYRKHITETYTLNHKGQEIENMNAFDIKLKKELDKPIEKQKLPIYISKTKDNNEAYVIPLRGKGLWGPIWGYIALQEDFNTIYGITFDHDSETPGLGAEIKDDPDFQQQFIGKKLFENGTFTSVKVVKGKAASSGPHKVNSISGATITSRGVENMLEDCIIKYRPYFKKQKNE